MSFAVRCRQSFSYPRDIYLKVSYVSMLRTPIYSKLEQSPECRRAEATKKRLVGILESCRTGRFDNLLKKKEEERERRERENREREREINLKNVASIRCDPRAYAYARITRYERFYKK